MPHHNPNRFIIARTLANVVLVFLAFAVVVPNCVVPAAGARPEYFHWAGLIAPAVVSVIATYCLWFWR